MTRRSRGTRDNAVERLWREFLDPGAEYAPVPFWFLNDRLTRDELARQLADFRDHGVYAVALHPRMGFPPEVPYLSDEFMEQMGWAAAEAARLNMRVMLYDEGMYPSGSAGGLVVREDPRHAARALVLEEGNYAPRGDEEIVGRWRARFDGGTLVPDTLREDSAAPLPPGWRRFAAVHTASGGKIRGIHFGTDSHEPGAPPAGNILDPGAVGCFIRLTHERYYRHLGKYFGNTIYAIFTDEPSPLGRGAREGAKPYTWGFGPWLAERGFDLQSLPLLWFDGEGAAETRALYARLVGLRLRETFYRPLFDWCGAHGIALAGHPRESDDVSPYRFMHIPGQDVVFRYVCPEDDPLASRHGVMAKAAADVARQLGRERNMNEAFGCCYRGKDPWDFPFSDAKWILDYLFARGCNLVTPHAFYYSVDGPGRYGERPPDVGPHSVWWPHYRKIARYIARMCFLNAGEHLPRVCVRCADGDVPAGPVRALYETQRGFAYYDPEIGPPEGPVFAGDISNIPRDLETAAPVPALRVRRMQKYGVGYLLLFNEGNAPISFSFTADKGATEVWLPWQGLCYAAPAAGGMIDMRLPARQSAVLVGAGDSACPPMPDELPGGEDWWETTPIRTFPVGE